MLTQHFPKRLLICSLLFILMITQASVPVYAQSVLATIPVSGNPSGIAVNPTTNHIFVTTFGPGVNNVVVLDGSTNAIVTTLTNVGGGSSIAANPTTNRIYTVDFKNSTVAVIQDAAPTGAPGLPVTGEPVMPIFMALGVGLILFGFGLTLRRAAQRV